MVTGDALVMHRIRTVGAMSVSFVVQLTDAALREGRLAGRVEVVETGQRLSFPTASELVAFLLERGLEQTVLAGAP